MKFDHKSVASISFHEAGGDEFLGTGFLVAKTHVVTCAHVLPGDTANRNCDGGGDDDEFKQIRGLTLYFGGNRASGEKRTGSQIARSPDDLALIILDEPVELPPVPLVSGFADYKGVRSKIRGLVIGFSGSKRELVKRHVRERITAIQGFDTNHILTIQMRGGLPQGMSGSPFIVQSEKGGACFAIASWGGEGRANSVFIGAELVIQFLKTNKVPLETVPASDYNLSHLLSKKTLVAIAVIVILISASGFVLRFSYRPVGSDRSTSQVSASTTSIEQNLAVCTAEAQGLSDEEVQSYIREELDADDPDKAFCFFRGMAAGVAKSVECQHLCDYAIKHGKPDLATKVVEQCPPGSIPQDMLTQINHLKNTAVNSTRRQ